MSDPPASTPPYPRLTNILVAGRPSSNLFIAGTFNDGIFSSNAQRQSLAISPAADPPSSIHIPISLYMHHCFASIELVLFRSKVTWLLVFGPVALIGKSIGLGESTCFVLAGLALIPLAERLSFVTEEVARHTSQTIGALLNATFGNAPELLISSAALKEGFYRVVQLTLLGSILTNLLFVFGLSCLIGGLRFQVQELRIVTGNASIGMLMLAVAGLALPAALKLSSEIMLLEEERDKLEKNTMYPPNDNGGLPSVAMVGFSRFDATIMVTGYILFLFFQLGTHRDEFEDSNEEDEEEREDACDDEEIPTVRRKPLRERKVRKNTFCRWLFMGSIDDIDENTFVYSEVPIHSSEDEPVNELELSSRTEAIHVEPELSNRQIFMAKDKVKSGNISGIRSSPTCASERPTTGSSEHQTSSSDISSNYMKMKGGGRKSVDDAVEEETIRASNVSNRRRFARTNEIDEDLFGGSSQEKAQQLSFLERSSFRIVGLGCPKRSPTTKSHCSDGSDAEDLVTPNPVISCSGEVEHTHLSFQAGLSWLFMITLCISAMSDILVDTIDGFAFRYGVSEVFTSLVILPYFSNIAEQASAVIFAYRNEMDLCVGITVGSAVQIALFVLPGSVLIGWAMDRSMSLFFRGFETCCIIFSVVSVAAVLQGGTTNWLVGVYLLGVYFMIAAGFWFHELENLSIDGELIDVQNHTFTR